MSIIKKAYEISLWDDVWDSNGFKEKKILVIGSDKMRSQNKVFEPNFVTNVNGTKQLSFSIYTKYIDNVTGEWVDNPFVSRLVNERKVKLSYKGKIHDFIIKNIIEDSETHINKYELKDALVLELSKNGFGVVLDEKVGSGVGTAKEIAEEILQETDWTVESECLVKKIEEGLVHITIPEGTIATLLMDEWSEESGENFLTHGLKEVPNQLVSGSALAFYSACKNKPSIF